MGRKGNTFFFVGKPYADTGSGGRKGGQVWDGGGTCPIWVGEITGSECFSVFLSHPQRGLRKLAERIINWPHVPGG